MTVRKDLNIGRGCELRALFSFGTQVEIAVCGREILLRESGHRQSEQFGERLQNTEIVVEQEFVAPSVKGLEAGGVVIEIGRRLVGRDQRRPMLMLPAFRVVDAHVAHRCARTVGAHGLHRQFQYAARRENACAVAFGAFDEVLAAVDRTPFLRPVGAVFDAGQIGCGKDRHVRSILFCRRRTTAVRRLQKYESFGESASFIAPKRYFCRRFSYFCPPKNPLDR